MPPAPAPGPPESWLVLGGGGDRAHSSDTCGVVLGDAIPDVTDVSRQADQVLEVRWVRSGDRPGMGSGAGEVDHIPVTGFGSISP